LPQDQTPLAVRLARRAGPSLRAAWERAKNERSSPLEIALSVGLGVFSACTPLLGLHMWIAMGLATVLRLNRLWAFLGSRCTFMPIFAGVAFAEIEVAHRLRTGSWVSLQPAQALARGPELLRDWAIGTFVVGGAIAALAAAGTYVVASSVARPAPGAAPGSSSGYPRSAPQGPPP
jgi:uncharacterized protein (DUF2062 family)